MAQVVEEVAQILHEQVLSESESYNIADMALDCE